MQLQHLNTESNLEATIDSAADVSMMSADAYVNWTGDKNFVLLRKADRRLRGAALNRVDVVGMTSVPCRRRGIIYKLQFFIVDAPEGSRTVLNVGACETMGLISITDADFHYAPGLTSPDAWLGLGSSNGNSNEEDDSEEWAKPLAESAEDTEDSEDGILRTAGRVFGQAAKEVARHTFTAASKRALRFILPSSTDDDL